MTFLYLLLNLASFSIPFLYSFEKNMRFIKWWKTVFLSIIIVAIPFIIWDVIFTQKGVWGFNALYHLEINLFGIPLEEVLFFICIPYACIFTHYAFTHFFKEAKLSLKVVRMISIVMLVLSIIILILFYPRIYTTTTFILFGTLMGYSLIAKGLILTRFYITFLIILVPFFVVNGILTGTFILDEVVWYNDSDNLGIRIGTIPVEDMFYAFNLLYLNLIIIEKLNFKVAK